MDHAAYLPAEDLVDGRRLLEGALRHHLGAHLLHVQHEGVERLLDVGLLFCEEPVVWVSF